jgi:tripartite-type tricarboxylate transporter receptor subunit TctC
MKQGKVSVKAPVLQLVFCLVLFAVLTVPLVVCGEAAAQAWKPTKAIHMLVPVAPGGGSYDSQARMLASEMSKILKQPVVVENVPGAGQALATNQLARANPDGYTILYTNSTSLILNQYVYAGKYDYRKLEYLGQLYDNGKTVSSVYLSGKNNPINTWNDVMNMKKPVRFGTVGKGSMPHFMGVATSHAFGLKNTVYLTGYTASADICAGAARGEFDLGVFPISSVESFLKSGDIKVVLLLSKKDKIPGYEHIQTIGELGHPEVVDQTTTRHVILAPPETPKDVVKSLSDVVYAAVSGPGMGEFQKKVIDNGLSWAPATGEQARKMVEDSYTWVQQLFPLLKE